MSQHHDNAEMRYTQNKPLDHGHPHGPPDPTLLTTEKGIRAVKLSFIGLFITAMLQLVIVYYSGSVALLADTIHNLGDATTAIPLWIAFSLARRKPTRRFTYGYGRVEDLAGVVIILTILFSAIATGYEAINRFFHPRQVEYLWAVVAASVVGFLGNELVAVFRIRVGKEINSASLVADGQHARVDGITSLGVLLSAIGIWAGYPLADPLVGLAITAAILYIVWDSIKTIFIRLLDGVDPDMIAEIRHTLSHVEDVLDVTDIRARWLGHQLCTEVNLSVGDNLSITEAHTVAVNAKNHLQNRFPFIAKVTVHTDPEMFSGEQHHRMAVQIYSQ